MSEQYVIEIETRHRDHDDADAWVERLAPWHGVVTAGPTGNLVVVLSLPAEDLVQACATGLAVLRDQGLPPGLAVTAQPESLRDERAGWSPVPELLSLAEAGERLGVSRQRVLQMIDSGKLPAVRVGKVYAVPAAALRHMER